MPSDLNGAGPSTLQSPPCRASRRDGTRDWYLGPHRPALFDTAGNAGPTIWVDGRIVGGWAVQASGEVLTWLLEDRGREASDAIETERARLTTWLGAAGAVPRFATPLAKELVRQGPGGQTGG